MKNLTEEQIIEERELREKAMNNADLNIFNKFKDIVFLGDDEVVTINQVAEYYGVKEITIHQILERHSNEFATDNVQTLRGDELKNFKFNH